MEAGDGNLILLAYEEFVQDLAQIFRDVCKSNFLQLQLVVTPNLLSENRESNRIEKRKNLSHVAILVKKTFAIQNLVKSRSGNQIGQTGFNMITQ